MVIVGWCGVVVIILVVAIVLFVVILLFRSEREVDKLLAESPGHHDLLMLMHHQMNSGALHITAFHKAEISFQDLTNLPLRTQFFFLLQSFSFDFLELITPVEIKNINKIIVKFLMTVLLISGICVFYIP